VEQERADLTERQGNGGSTDEPDTSSTGPREAKSDTQGPNEQLRDVTLLQGDNTAMFDWRVDLQDNNYKYDRLVEPVGHTEQRGGRRTPHSTTATLNLQPIRLLRCWSDDGIDRPSQTPRESTPWRGKTDSPVSHHNLWNREGCDPSVTPRSLYMTMGGHPYRRHRRI